MLHRLARLGKLSAEKIIFSQAEIEEHTNDVLRCIMEAAAPYNGDEFYQGLVRTLAVAMDVKMVFIAEIFGGDKKESKVKARTLAVWSQGGFAHNIEYSLVGTPCNYVIKDRQCLIQNNITAEFPENLLLVEWGVKSYYGIALENEQGECFGHIAVLDDKPMEDDFSSLAILKTFAARATAEIERNRIEVRLRDAERHFRLLYEQSPNPIILFDIETWKPIKFNDQAAEFMEYSRDAFINLTMTDLEVKPNPEATKEHIKKVTETGSNIFEAYYKTQNGKLVNVIVSLNLTEWYGQKVMLTTWHDITERKQTEAAILNSENRLSSIIESAMDGIVIIDDNHRIIRFNTAAEKIFKCNAQKLIGKTIDHLLPGKLAEYLLSKVNSSTSRQDRQQRWAPEGLYAKRTNGEVFPIELTVSPFTIGEQGLFTLIMRDVNDREKAKNTLRRLQQENLMLQERLQDAQQDDLIVTRSPAMWNLLSQAEKVAVTDSTVLLIGETGTGKELLAKTIHKQSNRNAHLLITVNCAALPKDLIESELFGHEKGAFTGAIQTKKGRFELADGGTIFLDEIGELTLEAQAKLLRVLQEKEIQRVGGEKIISVDVRVLAATHRDLLQMVGQGAFREDLYYRLSVFPLHIPPLRERKADIAVLVDRFVERYAQKFNIPLQEFHVTDIQKMINYNWPGNIRELQNIVERAAILAINGELKLEQWFVPLPATQTTNIPDAALDEVVREHMIRILEKCHWKIEGEKGAAVKLGLKPSTLRFRMKKLGVRRG